MNADGRRSAGLVLLGLLVIFFPGCLSPPAADTAAGKAEVNRLAGRWRFENPGYTGAEIIFSEDFQVSLQLDNISAEGTYRVDFARDPVHLDVVWTELGLVKTIIRFLDDYKLQMENNDPGQDRPAEFTDNSVLLLRADS